MARHRHRHHHGWGHHGGHHMHGMVSGQALLSRIVPNLAGAKRRAILTALPIFFIGAAIGIAMIILGLTSMRMEFGGSPDWAMNPRDPDLIPNFALIMPGGFILIVSIMVTGAVAGTRIWKMNRLFEVMNEINGRDKVSINSLSLTMLVGPASTVAIINRLIQTGNLTGYEVIGEVGVGRTGMGFTEADFATTQTVNVAVQPTPQQPRATRCEACGAARKTMDRFCNFCGAKF